MKFLCINFFLIFSFFIPTHLRAEPYFESKKFKVAAGGEYLSFLAKRGIITYDGWQIIPIFSVDLWNENLQLVGSTLNFKTWLIPDLLLYRTRLVPSAAGDRPMYYTGESEGARIRRTKTREWDHFLELSDHKLGDLSFQFSQDWSAHKGSAAELTIRPVFYNGLYKENGRPMIQAGLFGALGYGSAAHNSYLYGSSAGGWNYYSYGLAIASPAVIDPFYPVLKVIRSGLLGGARNGNLVREREHWQVIALVAFRVF